MLTVRQNTSWAENGAVIVVPTLADAIPLCDRLAPEHLELAVDAAEADTLFAKVRHAGSVFLGRQTPEAIGDYCAGPSHVLPTSATARFSSPLGVYDFQKRTSLISISLLGAQNLGRIAATLAQGEGLYAHAASAQSRITSKN